MVPRGRGTLFPQKADVIMTTAVTKPINVTLTTQDLDTLCYWNLIWDMIGNSAYDPIDTNGDVQPAYYADYFSVIYDRYLVKWWKIQINIINTSSTYDYDCVLWTPALGNISVGSWNELLNQPDIIRKQVKAKGTGKNQIFFTQFNRAKTFIPLNSFGNQVAQVDASPNSKLYSTLWMENLTASQTTLTCSLQIKVTQRVLFANHNIVPGYIASALQAEAPAEEMKVEEPQEEPPAVSQLMEVDAGSMLKKMMGTPAPFNQPEEKKKE